MLKKLNVDTRESVELINITDKITEFIKENNLKNGLITLFVPHTTAAITINENADPDVKKDIIKEINKIVPFSDNYKHREGNSAAHIKSSLFGSSETLIINQGSLKLGTWQSVYFCEFDGPRSRKMYAKISSMD